MVVAFWAKELKKKVEKQSHPPHKPPLFAFILSFLSFFVVKNGHSFLIIFLLP